LRHISLANPLVLGIYQTLLRWQVPLDIAQPEDVLSKSAQQGHVQMWPEHLLSWFEAAVQHTGVEHVAFKVGQQMQVEQLGVVGYLLRNAQNLGEALYLLREYNELTNNMVHLGINEYGHLTLQVDDALEAWPELIKHIHLLEIGYIVTGLEQLTLRKDLLKSTTTFLDPRVIQTLQLEVNATITHQHGCTTSFILAEAAALAPIVLPDAELLVQWKLLAEDQKKQHIMRQDMAQRLFCYFQQCNLVPTLAEAAQDMGMSVRSLQRNLSAEGTSYAELAKTFKQRKSQWLLSQGHTAAEVAYALGYGAPSAFSRARKGWG
jgi:AraC-like DNA-binding protein